MSLKFTVGDLTIHRIIEQETTFLPPSYQRPRIPVWVGGWWPNRAPLRRS